MDLKELKVRPAPDHAEDGPLAIRIVESDGAVCGEWLAGQPEPGARVKIVPGGIAARLETVTGDCIGFDRPVALLPGNVVCAHDDPLQAADQFEVDIDWCGKEPLLAGRAYDFLFGGVRVTGAVTKIKYMTVEGSDEHLAAKTLAGGNSGVCTISLKQEIAFAPFDENRLLGGFAMADRSNGAVCGHGKINFALRRASNIHRQAIDLDHNARAAQKGQAPCVVWFTGLSGSGKSTIANALEGRLHDLGKHTYLLDGDNIRHGLNRDLGFTDADRVENIRRIAEVARLMADAGLIVIASFISPFASERRMARNLMREGEFVEVFVDAPLELCEARDEKGLYAKARAGKIANFTGIDSDYERPGQAEITLDTSRLEPDESAEVIVNFLKENGKL